MAPTLDFESELWREGHRLIAGLDEVGRGSLAGPVVAGAVVLPVGDRALCDLLRVAGLRDSKKLSAVRRAALVPLIQEVALGVAVGAASAREIDEQGIVAACHLAMHRALALLPCHPTALLLDAFAFPDQGRRPQRAIVRGDDASLSIAAASVVAKVYRDALMVELDGEYPGYGFASNKGYGAAQHRRALQVQGATPLHRMSWKPLLQLALPGLDDGPP